MPTESKDSNTQRISIQRLELLGLRPGHDVRKYFVVFVSHKEGMPVLSSVHVSLTSRIESDGILEQVVDAFQKENNCTDAVILNWKEL